MDEDGVVKQTTTEQVIQNHQLSRTQSTEGIPMGEPSAPKILPLRFSQGDGFAKPTVTKLTTPANGFSHIFICTPKGTVLSKKERFPLQHPSTKFPLLQRKMFWNWMLIKGGVAEVRTKN
jgi:hypothetical protein